VGEEGINLSGGQKQLVALARALYRRPKVLLLDEATSAMDSKTEKFVVELLEKLSANMCIILVTHRYNLMGKIDHIYHLENGVTSQSELYIS
jgi:ATP-binding cassette subfamily B protein